MELFAPAVERPPVDLDALVASASRVAGFAVAPGEAALVLMGTSMDDLYDSHAARIRWAVWDKETLINGVAPEIVMARSDFTGGEIYLIYIDGQLVFLQPHHPEASAPVWADEVHEVAAIHAASIVTERVFEELVMAVAAQAEPAQVSSPELSSLTVSELRRILKNNNESP